jgi:hypothetical protein
MKGRMIHNLNGSQRPILYDPRSKQVLLHAHQLFAVFSSFIRLARKLFLPAFLTAETMRFPFSAFTP